MSVTRETPVPKLSEKLFSAESRVHRPQTPTQDMDVVLFQRLPSQKDGISKACNQKSLEFADIAVPSDSDEADETEVTKLPVITEKTETERKMTGSTARQMYNISKNTGVPNASMDAKEKLPRAKGAVLRKGRRGVVSRVSAELFDFGMDGSSGAEENGGTENEDDGMMMGVGKGVLECEPPDEIEVLHF